MSNNSHESLSALMDNEADALELRRILKEMETADPDTVAELKAKWQRYHVLGASVKQEIHSSPSCNLLSRVQEGLANDATPAKPVIASINSKGVFRVMGQGAIAASVALAVLFTADLAMVSSNDVDSAPGTEIADTSTGQLPGLTGELNPTTRTRIAVQNSLSDEEMNRLQQVVSEELEDTLEVREIPATFIPEKTP